MAARQNLAARQGNTLRVEFECVDGNGEPVDLTGSDLRFALETRTGTIRKSTTTGTMEMDAPAGVVRLILSPMETRGLPLGAPFPFYELERAINGDETTLIEGEISVTRGINPDG